MFFSEKISVRCAPETIEGTGNGTKLKINMIYFRCSRCTRSITLRAPDGWTEAEAEKSVDDDTVIVVEAGRGRHKINKLDIHHSEVKQHK